MSRYLLLLLMTIGFMSVVSAAQAVDLDQNLCENTLNATWTGATSTCESANSASWGVIDDVLRVPEGVELLVIKYNGDDLPANVGGVENYGTIETGVWTSGDGLANYGTFDASVLNNEVVFNHCGSTFVVRTDNSATIHNLTCSIDVGISPSPASGDAPLTVDWTVTLTNTGTDFLGSPTVDLSTDGGATVLATLAGPPDAGDNGNGILNVGETWTWVVQTTESADVTVTATGRGVGGSGLVITYPDDQDARDEASVTVAKVTSTTGSSTTTENTLPNTGSGDDLKGFGATGLILLLVGILLLSAATIVGNQRR